MPKKAKLKMGVMGSDETQPYEPGNLLVPIEISVLTGSVQWLVSSKDVLTPQWIERRDIADRILALF